MPDVTFSRADVFPEGTAVEVFEQAKVSFDAMNRKADVTSGLTAVDTATVSGGEFTVTLTADVPYVAAADVTPVPPSVTAQGSGTAWTITVSNATGGTFTISDGTNTTAAIAFNATSNQVAAALTAASFAGSNSAIGNAGGPWAVTLGTSATLTVNGSALTGATERRYLAVGAGSYTPPARIPHPYA